MTTPRAHRGRHTVWRVVGIALSSLLCAECGSAAPTDGGASDLGTGTDAGDSLGAPCSIEGQEICEPSRHARCFGGHWIYLGSPCDAGSTDSGPCALPAFDRSCTTRAECTVGVRHHPSCGVDEDLTGIARGELARFEAADTACVTATPHVDGGCFGGSEVTTDDGIRSDATAGYAYYAVTCVSGMCATTTDSFSPGGCRCARTNQTCNGGNGGCSAVDAGLGPSMCVDIPAGCTSCDCLAADACFGTCVAVVPGVGAVCSC